MTIPKKDSARSLAAAALTAMLAMPFMASAEIPISQRPLILGDSDVPGNLFLAPSLEWPTMNSIANIGGYSPATAFVGYFNAEKCYEYQFSAAPEDRHWAPTGLADDRECDGDDEWSGNFLNWAATQTVDPFRLALTGGYRVRDIEGETWLQKARHDGQGNQYPDRTITNDSIIEGATPYAASRIDIRIDGLSNNSLQSPMRFWFDGNGNRNSPEGHYNPDAIEGEEEEEEEEEEEAGIPEGAFDAFVRVSVCTDEAGMREDLCREYDNGYKPEGLIQEFGRVGNPEGLLRYTVFGYLNDHDRQRDGGVLRAGTKFVGPTMLDASTGAEVPNPEAEWDPDTGILFDNPNPADATATTNEFGVTIEDSGVINYINKLGQLNTNDYKSTDPLSELYYTVNRYVRNLGPVSAYHDLPGNTGVNVQQALDNFPVITNWEDPLDQYFCAPNVGLSIADVFTHRDKNLPGNASWRNDEPTLWAEVEADHDNNGLDVVDLTNRVGTIEGIGGNIGETNAFTGRYNSAYITGLAYDMQTRDQRSDLQGDQTMSSYMVDVVENQNLVDESNNMLYLAAKYGGFDVPTGFDPATRTNPLPEGWWTDGDSVSAGGTTYSRRPRNYFLANEARRMVDGLRQAFERIAAEATGSAAAVAANTTETTTDTLLYQARFNSGDWSGDIVAFPVDPADGTVDEANPAWRAANGIPSTPSNRDVYRIDPSTDTGNRVSVFSDLTADQRAALDSSPLTSIPGVDGEALMRYLLLGDTTEEQRNGGGLRDRPETVLGDIVNSAPFVARGGNFGYSILPGVEGEEYPDHLDAKTNWPDMLYVGANDGMLHAFDATQGGGDELFAFAPDAVFDNLAELADPDYTHQFFVDGQVRVADARYQNNWESVLVASAGAGAQSVFTLNVSDPTNFSAGDVIWEFSADDNDGMGNVLGDVHVLRLNDGRWAALFGNGYNSDDGTAQLMIVPLDDPGAAIAIDTGIGDPVNDPNGLGGVTPVDIQGNGTVDRVYGGDLEGNLWRFDLSSSNPNQWDNPGNRSVIIQAVGPGGDPQSITATPEVALHSDNDVDVNVLFGTGRFFAEGDNVIGANPQIHSFYAVQDEGNNTINNRNQLKEQEILSEGVSNGTPFRVLSDNPLDGKAGWFIDLVHGSADGERVVEQASVVGDRVFFLTQIPEGDICGFGGRSWLMEMDAESGSRTQLRAFDDVDPDAGAIGFDQLASGLTGLRGEGTLTFYPSLSDASLESVTVDDPLGGDRGRQSWRELR